MEESQRNPTRLSDLGIGKFRKRGRHALDAKRGTRARGAMAKVFSVTPVDSPGILSEIAQRARSKKVKP